MGAIRSTPRYRVIVMEEKLREVLIALHEEDYKDGCPSSSCYCDSWSGYYFLYSSIRWYPCWYHLHIYKQNYNLIDVIEEGEV